MRRGAAAASLAAICLAATSGCKVQVNNHDNTGEHDVRIATPMGGINVNTNETTAPDLGLPEYPGSHVSSGSKSNKSANVSMGFGGWQLRVKVVNYETPDSQDKVIAFYRKALSSYGDVIECAHAKPVGSPAVTGEGLSCDEHGANEGRQPRFGDDGLQLKAGSRHHQHLVVFKSHHPGRTITEFALIALDLPYESEGKQRQTN